MTKAWIQFTGLIALSLLAGGLLGLVGYALNLMGNNISDDGKVPVLDAGLFTASLLAFQQVVGAIRSVWESQERADMAENLQNSTPTQGQKPGVTTTTTTVEPTPERATAGEESSPAGTEDDPIIVAGAPAGTPPVQTTPAKGNR